MNILGRPLRSFPVFLKRCIGCRSWPTICGGAGTATPRPPSARSTRELWERVAHNPVKLLREVKQAKLDVAAGDRAQWRV